MAHNRGLFQVMFTVVAFWWQAGAIAFFVVHGVQPVSLAIDCVGLIIMTTGAVLAGWRENTSVAVAGILAILMGLNTFVAMLPLLSTDLVFRMRAMALNMAAWKQAPVFFAFNFRASVIFLAWSLTSDVIAHIVSTNIHRDDIGLRMYSAMVFYTCGYVMYSLVSVGQFRAVYDAHQELAAEKRTMQALFYMLCDAAVWVRDDCNTVIHCDGRFNLMMGMDMQGKQLDRCLLDEVSEQQRLRGAFARARESPVLLPTTLVLEDGLKLMVDCLIVSRVAADVEQAATEESPAFLVGIRSKAEVQVTGSIENVVVNNMDLVAPAQDDMLSSLPSIPETTTTGRVFADMNLLRQLELAADRDVELLRRLETVAELGKQEGWLLNSKHVLLQPDEILGVGSFGVVIGAALHGTAVAVKLAKHSKDCVHVKFLSALANEIRILRHLRHPSVVTFHGACVEPDGGEICLVMERLHAAMDLWAFVSQHSTPQEVWTRYKLLLEVACALRYLHAQSPQVVHGDLKNTNILVEMKGLRIKLIDFGISRLRTANARPLGGTLAWMAPEVVRSHNSRPQPSADTFSFGRVAHMIVTCQKPLGRVTRNAIIECARQGRAHPLTWPQEGPLQLECRALCDRCSRSEVKLRPSMREVHLEISAWQLPEAEAEVPALGMLRTQEQLNDGSVCGTDSGALWQAALRKVREVISLAPPPKQIASCSLPQVQRLSPLSSSGRQKQSQTNDPAAATGPAQPLCREGDTGLVEGANAAPELLIPNLNLTKSWLKHMMILDDIMQWNFPVPQSACCWYHASLQDLEAVLVEMMRLPCMLDLEDYQPRQCHKCGVLDPDDYSAIGCFWCAQDSKQSTGSGRLSIVDEDAQDCEPTRHICL